MPVGWIDRHASLAAGGAADGVEEMLTAARRGDPALLPIAGFDTFWYTWSGVNRDTRLLDR